MVNHLCKYEDAGNDIKKAFQEIKKNNKEANKKNKQQSSSTPSITNIPVITLLRLQQIQLEANLIQSSIDNYADKPFSTHRKKAIYKQIGRAVASANLPFSFVDDPEVKKLFALFNSYFKLPSRKWLSTDIIEDLNNDVIIEIQNFITNSHFIILSGIGWTSQTRNNIVNYVLVNENRQSELYKIENKSNQQHLGKNVYMDYKEVGMKIGLEKWAEFVTDNDGNYANARRLMNSVCICFIILFIIFNKI